MTPTEIIQNGPAIVTGAGTGLGRALARKIAERGTPVALLGRQENTLTETAATRPDRLMPYVCDVSDAGEVQTVVDAIARDLGTPRILINNAAVYPHRDILELPQGAFMQTMETNLGGIVNAVQSVLPYMIQDGVGRILNVATFADMSPLPMSSEYSTSKGAARIFTRALIADIADRFPDIVVSDWMPGMLATQMGIEDGLDPNVAAGWGAALAMMHDPQLTGTTFEMDREILAGSALKRKLKALLTLSRPQKPRILTPL
ncbi:SDR family oxidoreductase [Planktotalea sp.]|uniref:SDR family oxidoreductase n=1 Tax=Planktotalea sp. TaxID=2029877 RepID=UPI003D6A7E6A